MGFNSGNFIFKGPFKSLAGAVARRTIMTPIYGPYSSDEELNSQYTKLVNHWRQLNKAIRAEEDCGLPVARLNTCYGCMPAGVHCSPQSISCGCSYLCPFCWARDAQDLFRAVRSQFKSIEERYRGDHFLTVFRAKIDRPYDRGRVERSLQSSINIAAAIRRKIKTKLDTSGAYFKLVINPAPQEMWSISPRGLLMGGTLLTEKDLSEFYPTTCSVKSVQAPVPVEIAKMVSWMMRYPKHLICSDAARIAVVLRARQGKRLSASYGCLRAYERNPLRLPAGH